MSQVVLHKAGTGADVVYFVAACWSGPEATPAYPHHPPLHQTLSPVLHKERARAHTLLNFPSLCPRFLNIPHPLRLTVSLLQGDDELAIDVMDRLSPSILESFIHLTGADQVTGGISFQSYASMPVHMCKCVSLTNAASPQVFLKHTTGFKAVCANTMASSYCP